MHLRNYVPLVALLALFTVGPLHAQTEGGDPENRQVRDGFWIQFGIGYSTFGCDFCDGRNNEFAGDFAIGGAVGDQWLVGFVANVSLDSEGGGTRTIGVSGLGAQYYPTPTGGFHLRGMFGVSTVEVSSGTFSSSSSGGIGGAFGIGYDTPRSGSFGFSPFADFMLGSVNENSFSAVRFGVAVSWH